ncbi:hypothetical protein D3C87_1652770 [compost metagenome]
MALRLFVDRFRRRRWPARKSVGAMRAFIDMPVAAIAISSSCSTVVLSSKVSKTGIVTIPRSNVPCATCRAQSVELPLTTETFISGCVTFILPSTAGKKCRQAVRPAPRETPLSRVRSFDASASRAQLCAASMRGKCVIRSTPASVACRRPEDRSTRRTPNCCSNCRIRKLTAGCVIPSSLAAEE